MDGYRPQLFTPPAGFGFYAGRDAKAGDWLELEDSDESDGPEAGDLDEYEQPPAEP